MRGSGLLIEPLKLFFEVGSDLLDGVIDQFGLDAPGALLAPFAYGHFGNEVVFHAAYGDEVSAVVTQVSLKLGFRLGAQHNEALTGHIVTYGIFISISSTLVVH